MNKGVKIKICGNTNQEDADLLVTYDIDSLGFIITNADHPNKISAEKARKIITNLPEHILSVAAVGQFSTDEIIDILHTTKAKALQIQRNCTLEDIIKIRHEFPNLIIWKAVFTHEKPDFQKILAFEDACDNILLHTKENEWPTALEITHVLIKPYILAGGLTLENIPKALILFKPYMIDLIRGVEDKPGKKNLNKINKLLKLIKI